jgi:hypothetical protein
MRPEQNQMQNRRIGSCFLLALGASVVLFCGVGTATAIEVNQNYTELQKAVLDGKEIHMILDLSACTVRGGDKPGPNVRGSMRFDRFMIQHDQTIAFSTTHFTVRPDHTPVNEFLAFRVQPDGGVNAHTSFLNPVTFAVTQEAEFHCDIGRGATFRW